MSAKTLRALCIGDKVAATPSWGPEWNNALTVVTTDETDDGRTRVSLRRRESEGEPTYHLVAERSSAASQTQSGDVAEADRVGVIDRHGRRLGFVRNLARVGATSRVKRTQLQFQSERREMPEGDNSWKKYYERRGEA